MLLLYLVCLRIAAALFGRFNFCILFSLSHSVFLSCDSSSLIFTLRLIVISSCVIL